MKHPSLIGQAHDDWGDPIAAFTFEDCRDTGMTRLFRAGCTLEQIASWPNHSSVASLRELLDAYLDIDGEIADPACNRLARYTTQKGFAI